MAGDFVAPYTGAWIEIEIEITMTRDVMVAPYTGAWIEIYDVFAKKSMIPSHPTRVRGLK